ncbi:MAG: nicotinate (nicotinamide) nucleotide adenylyltransferase [Pseudomonadota bacterium]
MPLKIEEQPAPRIGLLGGSFNPAHDGHRELSVAAIKQFDLDTVWWLVSPRNPLKDPADYAPFQTRLAEARRVANHPSIVVSDYELRRNLTYTVDTLKHLREELPHLNFLWLMGADSLSSFHDWKDWRKIARLVPFAVFNRPGEQERCEQSKAAKELAGDRLDLIDAGNIFATDLPSWVFVPYTNNKTSATEIRRLKEQPRKN